MVKAFGTAGVRGVFNSTQTPEQVYRLAETVGAVFGKGAYGVGWDGRKVSALLAKTVASAISAVGSDSFAFGCVPTPVMAFGTRRRGCIAGFSVTASHNPPEFSGVKVFNGKGMELAQSDEERIERALAVQVMRSSGVFGTTVDDVGILDEYVESLVARYERVSAPLNIAIDCANGPGGLVAPRILGLLGHHVIPVNAQVSWRFPARQPEPTRENVADFMKMVPGLGVDFGFAQDGDADRLVMVDRNGNVLPDSMAAIISMRGLDTSSGTVVISENTSRAVEEEAEKLGFEVVRSRVGKSFALLDQLGGVFGTEPSKIIDPRWGLWEDGINAAAMISSVISRDRGLLDRLVSDSKWHYKQVNFNVGVDMAVLVQRAKEAFRRFRIAEERFLDGYKIVFNNGSWVMFRPSGTEPKTRLYCESKDPDQLAALIEEGRKCVELSL